MDSCGHESATYVWDSDGWGYACPSPELGGCGLATATHHPGPEEASKEWKRISRPRMDEAAIQKRCGIIRRKQAAGESLTKQEQVVLAYAPVELGGTAASCPSSVVFTRDFLLGST